MKPWARSLVVGSVLASSTPAVWAVAALSVGDVVGAPGIVVSVPVNLGAVSNMGGASFVLDLSVSNPAAAPPLAAMDGASPGSIATGSFFAADPLGTRYRVAVVSAASGKALSLISGPGVLSSLPVAIPADATPGTTYTLAIEDAELVDGTAHPIAADTAAGTLTVQPSPVASVSVTPNPAAVNAGDTLTLTATARDAHGQTIPNVAFTWSVRSGATALVSVDAGTGAVIAFAPGSATVQATAAGGTSGTTLLIVSPGPAASLQVMPATASVAPGATQLFTVSAQDAMGNPTVAPPLTWSADAAIGTEVKGLFTATGVGTGHVTATAGSLTAFAVVSVSPGPGISLPGVLSGQWIRGLVSLLPSVTNLGAGMVQLFADGGGMPLALATAAPFVLTLDTTALPDGPHALTVTARSMGGETAQTAVQVNVLNAPPTAAITAPSASASVGGQVSVMGTADAAVSGGFASFALAVAPGDTLVNAAPIGMPRTAPVRNGLLGIWDTSGLPAGQYTLVLTVTDRAGNQSQAHELVRVARIVKGDLNGDGRVNVLDATLALRIVVGLLQPTPDQVAAGDLHHVGKITIADATLILRAAVGLVTLM